MTNTSSKTEESNKLSLKILSMLQADYIYQNDKSDRMRNFLIYSILAFNCIPTAVHLNSYFALILHIFSLFLCKKFTFHCNALALRAAKITESYRTKFREIDPGYASHEDFVKFAINNNYPLDVAQPLRRNFINYLTLFLYFISIVFILNDIYNIFGKWINYCI